MQYAIDLINTYDERSGADVIRDLDGLAAFARARQLQRPQSGDLSIVHELRASLRAIFGSDDLTDAVHRVNALLSEYNSAPRLVLEPGNLHVHFEPAELSLGPYLAAITAVALMFTICDHGVHRLGLCAATSCGRAYIDTTKNGRKTYCSNACTNRANVALHRARHRAT